MASHAAMIVQFRRRSRKQPSQPDIQHGPAVFDLPGRGHENAVFHAGGNKGRSALFQIKPVHPFLSDDPVGPALLERLQKTGIVRRPGEIPGFDPLQDHPDQSQKPREIISPKRPMQLPVSPPAHVAQASERATAWKAVLRRWRQVVHRSVSIIRNWQPLNFFLPAPPFETPPETAPRYNMPVIRTPEGLVGERYDV